MASTSLPKVKPFTYVQPHEERVVLQRNESASSLSSLDSQGKEEIIGFTPLADDVYSTTSSVSVLQNEPLEDPKKPLLGTMFDNLKNAVKENKYKDIKQNAHSILSEFAVKKGQYERRREKLNVRIPELMGSRDRRKKRLEEREEKVEEAKNQLSQAIQHLESLNPSDSNQREITKAERQIESKGADMECAVTEREAKEQAYNRVLKKIKVKNEEKAKLTQSIASLDKMKDTIQGLDNTNKRTMILNQKQFLQEIQDIATHLSGLQLDEESSSSRPDTTSRDRVNYFKNLDLTKIR